MPYVTPTNKKLVKLRNMDADAVRIVSRKLRDVESDSVRISLIQEGMRVSDLAHASGLKYSTLASALSKGFPDLLTRWKVEAGFKYRRPIWSTARDLDRRCKCLKRFGFDPFLEGVRELRRLAKDIGADFSLCRDKTAMIQEVFARAAIPDKTSTIGKT
jgi:hypothetical protein